MEKNRLDRFRNMLMEMRARTSGDLERQVEGAAEEFGEDLPDINDDATRATNRRIMLEISGKSHQTLVSIADALERVETGEYGQCQECGDEIPEKRLELLPFARYCVRCQEELEKQG